MATGVAVQQRLKEKLHVGGGPGAPIGYAPGDLGRVHRAEQPSHGSGVGGDVNKVIVQAGESSAVG